MDAHTDKLAPYAVRFLSFDAVGRRRVRTVTGCPMAAGALLLARDLVLDHDGDGPIAAHVLDVTGRVLSTVSVFDEIVDDWFAFAAAARTR